MERFKVEIENVAAVIAGLPKERQGSNTGIVFDDGELVALDDEAAEHLKKAVRNIGEGRKLHLRSYAAAVCKARLAQGVVVVKDHSYGTDVETLARLSLLLPAALADPSKDFNWKTQEGFVRLDGDDLKAVMSEVGAFIDKCFAVEAALAAKIEKGNVTTEEIDNAAWPQ